MKKRLLVLGLGIAAALTAFGLSFPIGIPYAIWATIALTGFGYEIYAGVNKQEGDTLTDLIHKWITGQSKNRALPAWLAWTNRVGITAFLAWLILHLGWGIL